MFDIIVGLMNGVRQKCRRICLTFDEWTSIANKQHINVHECLIG